MTVTSAPHNHTSRKDKETEKAAYTASIHQANSASLLCEGGSKLNCSQQNRRCHPYQTSHSHHRTPALRSLQRKACKALLEDCAAFSHVIPKLQRVWSSPCTTIGWCPQENNHNSICCHPGKAMTLLQTFFHLKYPTA